MHRIKLIFEDNEQTIEFKASKDKLLLIPYFKTMASFQKKDLDDITITVPNAYVAYDVIQFVIKNKKTNLGNITKWRHVLESHVCYEYFGLDFDVDQVLKADPKLYDLPVPCEDFELLIKTFEIVKNGYAYIRLIGSVLKTNPNLIAKISKDTMMRIYNDARMYYILNKKGCVVLIWNSKNSQQFTLIRDDPHDIFDDALLSNHRSMIQSYHNMNQSGFDTTITDRYIFYSSWMQPEIIDILTQKNIFSLEGNFNFCICFSPFGLCAYTYGHNIDIYDIATNTVINSINVQPIIRMREHISKLFFTSDKQIIVLIDKEDDDEDDENSLLLIDTTNKVTRIKCSAKKIYKMCALSTTTRSFDDRPVAYSHDLKTMAIESGRIIEVMDLSTGKIIKRLIGHIDVVTKIHFSPDDEYIISTSHDCDMRIWKGEETVTVVNKFLRKENERYGSHICFIVPNNYELIQQIKQYCNI